MKNISRMGYHLMKTDEERPIITQSSLIELCWIFGTCRHGLNADFKL